MNNLLRIIFSRMILVGLSLLIQLAVLIIIILRFGNYFIYFYTFCLIISVIAVLWIINNNNNPAYKITWLVLILLFPIFGGLFYLMFGGNRSSKRMRAKNRMVEEKTRNSLKQTNDILTQLQAIDPQIAKQAIFLTASSDYPVYQHTSTEYFALGEDQFGSMLDALNRAEHYIFLEYFIVEEGLMWDSILEILVAKAASGVDVRMIYDDIGCVLTLPHHYERKLQSLGIKCKVFNPFTPVLSARLNNRDHRKIVIIDGHTAYTGGTNLADEYINAKVKYGHWKDTAIKICGEAAWSFTVMFLTFWDYLGNETVIVEVEDYNNYRPYVYHNEQFENDGFVLPYADSPLDDESTAKIAYLNIINGAKKYVYITTPYLILDNELTVGLCAAAKSGVDVRIITPHIPDKWYVFGVTRANYPILLRSGVKIYEYTPGFMHSKCAIADDEVAIIGSINLDYRSLYLHFECAAWLYQTNSIADIKNDFDQTLAVSQLVTLEECSNRPWYTVIGYSILRLFAPLM